MEKLTFSQLMSLRIDLERDVNTNLISKKYSMNFQDIAKYRAMFIGDTYKNYMSSDSVTGQRLEEQFKKNGFSPVTLLIINQMKRLKNENSFCSYK